MCRRIAAFLAAFRPLFGSRSLPEESEPSESSSEPDLSEDPSDSESLLLSPAAGAACVAEGGDGGRGEAGFGALPALSSLPLSLPALLVLLLSESLPLLSPSLVLLFSDVGLVFPRPSRAGTATAAVAAATAADVGATGAPALAPWLELAAEPRELAPGLAPLEPPTTFGGSPTLEGATSRPLLPEDEDEEAEPERLRLRAPDSWEVGF